MDLYKPKEQMTPARDDDMTLDGDDPSYNIGVSSVAEFTQRENQ